MPGEGWKNWSGRVACDPARVERPADEAGIAAAVRRAVDEGRRLRVVGSGHSFTPLVATDGILLSLDAWTGVESFDPDSRQAVVRAGTKIHALGEPLRALGGALANQGDIDIQAIGGAIGTGTHGTGPGLGSLSTQVVGLRLVNARGEFEEWPAAPATASASGGFDDADRLDAARVSLGLLGVLTAVRLQLVAPYRLREREWWTGIDECLDRLDERIAAHRHYEFFWFPHNDAAQNKSLDTTDEPPNDHLAGEDRVDWSDRIFPSVRDLKFNEMEYAVPAAAGPACLRAVRERMKTRHPEVLWPVEYRTLAADRIWLSPAHGRDTVTISLHQGADLPCDEFFRDCESIFTEHGGRPHWGKLHTRGADELRALYPMWNRFVALRRAVDPAGTFLNPHLEPLFGAAAG